VDEETARWYAANYGDHPTNAATVEFADLLPDDVVLDIGCGSGTAVREAAVRVTDGRVIGVDPSPAMLRIAREQTASHPGCGRIELLDGSAEQLPLDDASITVAMAINSIHHWHDVDQGLGEVRRILAPGGRFLITEEVLSRGRFGHGEPPLTDPDRVVGLLELAGFEQASVHAQGDGEDAMCVIQARNPRQPDAEAW
jgi:SAM-dependent methyltransferase